MLFDWCFISNLVFRLVTFLVDFLLHHLSIFILQIVFRFDEKITQFLVFFSLFQTFDSIDSTWTYFLVWTYFLANLLYTVGEFLQNCFVTLGNLLNLQISFIDLSSIGLFVYPPQIRVKNQNTINQFYFERNKNESTKKSRKLENWRMFVDSRSNWYFVWCKKWFNYLRQTVPKSPDFGCLRAWNNRAELCVGKWEIKKVDCWA